VSALDVSSNNGLNIAPLLDEFAPQHVIVKLYQTVEKDQGGPLARFSIAQARMVREHGCTVGGYVWLYAGIDGAKQVADALDTAQKAGVALGERNPLWLDCEDYTDKSYPSLAVIQQAINACDDHALVCGIYTGGWWWRPRTGNSQAFSDLPLWDANYDDPPGLGAPGYGGWQARSGHQYTSKPVDRSVFNSAYATP
jgi:GH25 family lysozyme M1 (1,4-beta-N-acetylmuramidase)